MPPPPHATQVCCPEYLDRLLAEGHERGYCVLEAVGMGFLAEDMDGWTQDGYRPGLSYLKYDLVVPF